MKRLIIVGIVGLALLTGCTANHDGDFFKVMRVMPTFQTSTDAQLRTIGQQTCKIFDAAKAVPDVNAWDLTTANSEDAGLTASQSVLVAVASVTAYCPEYKDKVPAEYLQ